MQSCMHEQMSIGKWSGRRIRSYSRARRKFLWVREVRWRGSHLFLSWMLSQGLVHGLRSSEKSRTKVGVGGAGRSGSSAGMTLDPESISLAQSRGALFLATCGIIWLRGSTSSGRCSGGRGKDGDGGRGWWKSAGVVRSGARRHTLVPVSIAACTEESRRLVASAEWEETARHEIRRGWIWSWVWCCNETSTFLEDAGLLSPKERHLLKHLEALLMFADVLESPFDFLDDNIELWWDLVREVLGERGAELGDGGTLVNEWRRQRWKARRLGVQSPVGSFSCNAHRVRSVVRRVKPALAAVHERLDGLGHFLKSHCYSLLCDLEPESNTVLQCFGSQRIVEQKAHAIFLERGDQASCWVERCFQGALNRWGIGAIRWSNIGAGIVGGGRVFRGMESGAQWWYWLVRPRLVAKVGG
ncbi:hypothetical protein DFP72DRAFT_1100500 [Ephemerocybe angulata]|uniref:Uncharacterized protein n=1 Tax=Ephemerocybe angulata TaxID=980116 RepID=A0A8H6HAE7_9AGAR|nr:hypothetical protein DFP72DRAFT_1100500 [Tulosesus angulatus]